MTGRRFRLVFHREVLETDLPWFSRTLSPEQFLVFQRNLLQCLNEIRADPDVVGVECRFELAGWRRHKFFVGRRHHKERPMGRVVFRIDPTSDTVYVVAVWLRRTHLERDLAGTLGAVPLDSVYHVARRRAKGSRLGETAVT